MITTTTRRDGRNSTKRLAAAKADVLRAKTQILNKARQNAGTVIRLIEASGISDKYQTIQYHTWTGTWYPDMAEHVAEFLGVSVIDLAEGSIVQKHFETLWTRRFAGGSHASCESYALKELRIPGWSHLADTGTCVCCGTRLGCDHTFRELTQAECQSRNVYHAGHCYHVSECTRCGDISAVDSSD